MGLRIHQPYELKSTDKEYTNKSCKSVLFCIIFLYVSQLTHQLIRIYWILYGIYNFGTHQIFENLPIFLNFLVPNL